MSAQTLATTFTLPRNAASLSQSPAHFDWPGRGIGVLVIAVASLFSLNALCQSIPANSPVVDKLLLQAKHAEEKHDFQGAAGFYREFLKSHPDNAQILQRLGLDYYLSSDFRHAIQPLQKAAAINPSLWGASLFLGISYYRTGRFDNAAESLQRALALNPDLAECNFWYGATLLAKGQPEAAIPYLFQASRNPRTALESQSTLVQAYQKSAQEYEQRIIKLDPDSDRAHELMAESLEGQGQMNGAILEYQRALKANPNLEGAHRAMGELYWQRRDFDAAAREFEAEIRLNVTDDKSNLRLGEYCLAKGKLDAAVGYLHNALENHTPDLAEAWHFLGVAELAQHHFHRAETALESAVKLNPEEPSNYQLLMQDYENMGKPQDARQQQKLFEKFSALQKAKSTGPR